MTITRKKKARRASPRAAKPGRRAQNKERTRKEILKAALELFSKKGFFRTTTRQISNRARIAEGTLFNYFETKEDLALYFFEQELAGLTDWYQSQTKLDRAPLAEKLFAIIHRHLERITPYEEFIGAVYLRALQPVSKLNLLSLEAHELNVRYLRFIQEVLREAEEAGEIPKVGDFGAYAFGLFHLAIITYWLQDISPGKENTLALLDRSLKIAQSILKRGTWEW
ncbi:MAG: TetR/AcrR family transcriptional regulator [Verrucomicrobia subdivision 3 bacterium]|nr:TetR/AcrR family transcriptional regulator [Limisphaerales bacterium]